jgi:hypothetical protein
MVFMNKMLDVTSLLSIYQLVNLLITIQSLNDQFGMISGKLDRMIELKSSVTMKNELELSAYEWDAACNAHLKKKYPL